VASDQLTDEQRRVIGTRDVSMALSAGAGCGKTFVLTERYLAALDPRDLTGRPPLNLHEIVAITFTERAAREMRDRIRTKCYQRLTAASERRETSGQSVRRGQRPAASASEPAASGSGLAASAAAAGADYWLQLLRALDAARISTIHSFCAAVLRSHAVEAGLDPRFAVLEQAQAETLLLETIDDSLRTALADQDEGVLQLATDLGLDRLRSAIQTLLDVRDRIDFDRWCHTSAAEQVTIWQQFYADKIRPVVVRQVTESDAAQQILDVLRTAKISHKTMAARAAILVEALPNLSGEGDLTAQFEVITAAARVTGGGGKGAWDDEADYEQFKNAAEALRKTIKKVSKYASFRGDAALPAAAAGLNLLKLTATIATAYGEQKKAAGLLDFDDLLIEARRLLADPDQQAVRRQLAATVRLLVVDEFQDTDPLQVELIEAICGEELTTGKLLFVGDSKQSIYRFRGADPRVFLRLKEAIPAAGRLSLTRNFRSQPAVLDLVNGLFQGKLQDDDPPLRAHRSQVSPTPAIEWMWVPDPDPDAGRKGATERMRRKEAEWIARRVRAMIDSDEPLVGRTSADEPCEATCRKARLGDIALLFRALSNVQFYEEALRRHGIDYYLVGGHAFYAQQEIFDLLNLLRTLASPCDQVSLVGVLRSPFFALADETLYWLAQHAGGVQAGLLADEIPAEIDAAQRRRVAFAAQTITHLRGMKDRVPVAELIREALMRTSYDATLLAEFMGQRKLANLNKLVDMARASDRTGMFGLADFIFQLSQFVAKQPKEPLAATQPESQDVVRLMTIHQAKGLEFPIVFVPDLERRAQTQHGPAAFSPELGPLVKLDAEVPCCGYDFYAMLDSEADQQELLRLFYVACTRAADRLILSSGMADLQRLAGPWTELLAERFDLSSGRPTDSWPANLPVPEIVVIDTPPGGEGKGGGQSPQRVDWEKSLARVRQLAAAGTGEVAPAAAPLPVDRSARRRFSFSRLTGQLHTPLPETDEPEPVSPAAIDSARSTMPQIDPLGLGSLTHDLLERVPLSEARDVDDLARRLAPRHFDDSGPAAKEAARLVRHFLASDRAVQLADARQVHRELEFLLAWPPHAAGPVTMSLEGVIDCLYQGRDGAWHVLDYKTNRVTEQTLAEVAAGYQLQLYVYAAAAEQVLGVPPQSLVLYFLRPGKEFAFAWNDQARERLATLVDAALAVTD
jgi:ATP-dependent helicase/nuclease subunit A